MRISYTNKEHLKSLKFIQKQESSLFVLEKFDGCTASAK